MARLLSVNVGLPRDIAGLQGSNLELLMSALGQKRRRVCVMSALPPKADIAESDWPVRFVPIADIGYAPAQRKNTFAVSKAFSPH